MVFKKPEIAPVQLGLKQNWKQFWLLVLINTLVGGMIGLERTILPEIAKEDFGIQSNTIILSFIMVFGLAKSITNYLTGILADRLGRKNILVAGWVIGLPVPFILMGAQGWGWIVFANVLLGINQGFCWSSTVVMKIDLVGERQRGFAMGLNEFAGYVALALSALATSYIADRYGVRPYPFYLGVGFAGLGLVLSFLFVRDTTHHVEIETIDTDLPLHKKITAETTWKHKNLGSVTQAGFVNNLNDAMVWGILPILLGDQGYPLKQIGVITSIYPAVWGISQLFTGRLSDQICKKKLLFWGMLIQAVAIFLFLVANSVFIYASVAVILGIGTAAVYPTFLSSIAENVHPQQRAEALGIFRFWRDFGYVVGAMLTGLLSDELGKRSAILLVGLLTLISALIIFKRMYCQEKKLKVANHFLSPI